MYANTNNWHFCYSDVLLSMAPLAITHPIQHSVALLCTAAVCVHTQNNFSTYSGLSNLMRQHDQSPERLLIQVTLLFLLQEQVILPGPCLAQCPHFDISRHHRCPGTESKTFPLPTIVSSSINGFNRTHFFLTHCQIDDATDLEAALSSLIFCDP